MNLLKETLAIIRYLWPVISILILVATIGVISAKMESDTYNRLTGAHTTWWDALWVELRIQDKPQP